MCGIAGLVSAGETDPGIAAEMANALLHRGPDDGGSWVDPAARVGLAQRRLAIVDLSPQGHQPMLSADGRLAMVFNGEIYNHVAMRAAVEAAGGTPTGGWRGRSDTETLLQAIAVWGLSSALERAVGMFAIALWDHERRVLSLARDRFGEKPLYYGWLGRDFVFASELKAIRRHPRFSPRIDSGALQAYLSRTYVPAPLSIYQGIFKLPPASILEIDSASLSLPLANPPSEGRTGGVNLHRYWSYLSVMTEGHADPFDNEPTAISALENALADALRGQAVADVPVGAFLSGGIDSSTVVALYRKYTTGRVATYSIGFEEAGFDEAPFAAALAKYLGTEHHEHYVSVAEARDVIPLLPQIYDEPFADSSQIPTYLVSRFARRDVTVALSGDGGDELFAGYNRHIDAPKMWGQLSRIPQAIRGPAGAMLSRVPSAMLQRAGELLPGQRQPHFGAKMQKALKLAGAGAYDEIYDRFLDEWAVEGAPLAVRSANTSAFRNAAPSGWSATERTMYADAMTYLPDDIMVKVDRAAMACSLETRAPFLDHRVAAVAARIPLSFKIRDGRGKHILRQLLFQQAPQTMFERPKAGFAVPVGQWIKGPLREWAEDLLDPQKMAAEGLLDPEPIMRRWRGHLSGTRDATAAIWGVLMFQAWLRGSR